MKWTSATITIGCLAFDPPPGDDSLNESVQPLSTVTGRSNGNSRKGARLPDLYRRPRASEDSKMSVMVTVPQREHQNFSQIMYQEERIAKGEEQPSSPAVVSYSVPLRRDIHRLIQ